MKRIGRGWNREKSEAGEVNSFIHHHFQGISRFFLVPWLLVDHLWFQVPWLLPVGAHLRFVVFDDPGSWKFFHGVPRGFPARLKLKGEKQLKWKFGRKAWMNLPWIWILISGKTQKELWNLNGVLFTSILPGGRTEEKLPFASEDGRRSLLFFQRPLPFFFKDVVTNVHPHVHPLAIKLKPPCYDLEQNGLFLMHLHTFVSTLSITQGAVVGKAGVHQSTFGTTDSPHWCCRWKRAHLA